MRLKKPRVNVWTGEYTHPYTRVWVAVDRNRFKIVAFKVGDGDKSNFIDLALKIESHHGKPRYLCTDKYSVYGTYALGKRACTEQV